MKSFFFFVWALVGVLLLGSLAIGLAGSVSAFSPPEDHVAKPSILELDLKGVITDNLKPLETLRKYRKDKNIKGVLVRIDSPGGVVGPSQELYAELKRTRTEFKKPVVAYCGAVAASGAYYAAVGADKIVTTPGCMIGSIGVIMEFVNLQKLYDWAKIQRYDITTGKYKDAGAEFKPLTPDQRSLFQDMLNDVLSQFKAAVEDGRHLQPAFVDKYADGRVFTGSQAVKLGFADKLGTWDDARKMIGEMSGLGSDPEVFKPHPHKAFIDLLQQASTESRFSNVAKELLRTDLNARPLFVLPGAVHF